VSRVLALDYGERRIGVAISDPSATIAQPLPALIRRAGKRAPIAKIMEMIAAHDVGEIVIGLPLTLAGTDSEWTTAVREFAEKLEQRSQLPVHLMDERLTSVMAERAVRSLGLKKTEREQKERVDTAAAMILLQNYLNGKSVR
jgi:putative Holliday junction resolvase